MPIPLETQRLWLGRWQPDLLDAMVALHGDPKVRQYFPNVLDRDGAKALMQSFASVDAAQGYAFLPLFLRQTDTFVGHIGLMPVKHDFGPDRPYSGVEIGWALAPHHWRKGYATEMGHALIAYARDTLRLSDLVSFTALVNRRSEAVMKRLGFQVWGEFDHPNIATDHVLCRHVLYRHRF